MRKRSFNDDLSVCGLIDALTCHARDKACPWDWECAYYSKRRRTQGPDRQGLESYSALLSIIVHHAPGGLPSLVRLREVWTYLHSKFGIMAKDLVKAGKNPQVWANECGDMVRLMLVHVRSLKDSGTTWLTPGVKALIDKISIDDYHDDFSSASSGIPVALPAGEPAQVQLSQASIGSSVQLCGAQCRCPDCQSKVVIDVGSSQSSVASSSSMAAQTLKESVPAGRGEVKALAKEKEVEKQSKQCSPVLAKLVRRNNPAKAYILYKKGYLVGLSANKSAAYLDILSDIVDLCNLGSITNKEQAMEELAKRTV